MNGIMDLNIVQLALAYIFVIILLIIVKAKGMSRQRDILIGCIRMTLQLIMVGFILSYVFTNESPVYTVAIIVIMELFAVFNIFKRVKLEIPVVLKRKIALSMVTGTLLSLSYFLFIVIRISPWYKPQYFIPLAGMIIGNSMTGVSLGVDRLIDGMNSKKYLIETSLMLGATPHMASKSIVDKAIDSAIMPTINSMIGMGIVFLPGMMTGQILSGVSPLTAIKYQIAIMLGILGSVSLTVILFVHIGYKSFFNEDKQLDFDSLK